MTLAFFYFQPTLKRLFNDFNPFQDSPFQGCPEMEADKKPRPPFLPKVFHTYPTVMKLGPRILT